MVLAREPYRYRSLISDISGQDIHAHDGDPDRAIVEVRNWLQAGSKRKGLAGGNEIIRHYHRFRTDLPSICKDLTFIDLSAAAVIWLQTNR